MEGLRRGNKKEGARCRFVWDLYWYIMKIKICHIRNTLSQGDKTNDQNKWCSAIASLRRCLPWRSAAQIDVSLHLVLFSYLLVSSRQHLVKWVSRRKKYDSARYKWLDAPAKRYGRYGRGSDERAIAKIGQEVSDSVVLWHGVAARERHGPWWMYICVDNGLRLATKTGYQQAETSLKKVRKEYGTWWRRHLLYFGLWVALFGSPVLWFIWEK